MSDISKTLDQLFLSMHSSALNFEGGVTKVASKMHMRAGTLHTKLNPLDELHLLNISEFCRLIDATGNTEPLDILCEMFGGRFVSKSSETADSVLSAALHVASEGGDVMKSVEAALADGTLSDKERLVVKREIMENIASLNTLKNTLDKVVSIQANS